MRSWTSRGVPEWSGGKDLYMGSLILVAGKVSHFIGIVPGVPKGVRGSTRGPPASGGRMGCRGVRLGLYGPRAPAPRGPCAKDKKEGRVLKGEGTSEVPWGGRTPPWPHPSLEEGLRLHPPSPLALYIVGGREGSKLQPWAPPSSPATPLSLSRRSLAKPCRDPLHPPPRRRAARSPSTSPSPCWIKKEETSLHRTCVERGGAVRLVLDRDGS